MHVIPIVDSGFTKADWMAIQADGEELLQTKTIGLTPDLIDAKGIAKALRENGDLQAVKNRVSHAFFMMPDAPDPAQKALYTKC